MLSIAEMVDQLFRSDLSNAGWDGAESYYPGQTAEQYAKMSCVHSLLKKFHNDEVHEDLDRLALEKFLISNATCAIYPGLKPRDTFQEYVIGEMKSILYDFFNPAPGVVAVAKIDDFTLWRDREPLLLNLSDIYSCWDFGPGSNIDVKGTDRYTKYFNSSMCGTDQSLFVLYKHAVSSNARYKEAENLRQSVYPFETVLGSRISFVPKSMKTSRTICTEPPLNMLFQKGIGKLIEQRLCEFFNIDVSKQPFINAQMARDGSLTGEFGTIDLSSASDTISLSLCREIIPSDSMRWLELSRSKIAVLPDGREMQLEMISSMGNGFTFPLQTVIFAACVTAVYRVLDIPIEHGWRKARNYSVFGDDIIVDHKAYDLVVDMLTLMGFSVNRDKSFNQGFFRESCGHDYFSGRNVRGVYLQRLKDHGDFYSAINRLNRWSATHRVPLIQTVTFLAEQVPFLPVPFEESDDAGIKGPVDGIRHLIRHNRNGSSNYRAFIREPDEVILQELRRDIWSSDSMLRKAQRKLRKFFVNEDGLLIAALAGWLRRGRLGCRPSHPKVARRDRVCPGWDSKIPMRVENRAFREEWKIFSALNLRLPPFE
jgi:hypothetical protein